MSTVKKPSFWIGFVISVLIPCSSYALTTTVSVNDSDVMGDGQSYAVAMTPDGRYVLFQSDATNLVANDTNGTSDVFVKNMLTNEITRVSISSSGDQSDEASEPRAITPDGRYVLFDSAASNLITSGSNGYWGVYIRDLVNNTTRKVSMNSGGEMGDGYAYSVAMTPDGRYVLFQSDATNLVADDTNSNQDVFVRDMLTNEIMRMSVSSSGVESDSYSQATAISSDGRYVLFSSYGATLDPMDNNWQNDVFVRDMVNNTTTRASTNSNGTGSDGYSEAGMMTPDGRYVSFYSYATDLVPDDTNGVYDVFLKDMSDGTIVRASVDSSGGESNGDSSNPIVSSNGQYVVFDSPASNLVVDDTNGVYDVFVRDVVNNTTTRVSIGDDLLGMDSNVAGISNDMRYVFFVSYDYNWYQHAFVRDLVNNTTSRVDISSNGDVANSTSATLRQLISSGGDYVGFSTDATNITPNDSNGTTDVFVNQWKIILGAAPTIVSPSDGSYRNTHEIVVQGWGQSGADIRVTFLGNTFFTVVDANSEWIMQLPDQLDASYTVYAQQKMPSESLWSVTGSTSFTIDTTNPLALTIISPIDNATMSGGDVSIVGLGEPGGSATVKMGNTTKMVSIDGMGNWTAGPFTVVPGYQYAITAKQSDIAGNQSPWSLPVTIYGLKNTGPFSLSDYFADLFLIKRGTSDNTNSNFATGSSHQTAPGAAVRYTLEYDNVGNGYASGTVVHETIPVNTCYTIGSISGFSQGEVATFSNNHGTTYNYVPIGATGQTDCAVTDFRVTYVLPLSAKANVVSDVFTGEFVRAAYSDAIRVSVGPTITMLTGLQGDSTASVVGDFNNDGIDDVVISSYRYPSYNVTDWVVWGTGGSNMPQFAELQDSSSYPDSETHNVVKGNFNGDAYLDVLLVNGDAYYGTDADDWIYYGGATGFTKVVLTGSLGNGENTAVADFNNDGYDDAILMNGTYFGDRGPSKIARGGATGVTLQVLSNVRGYLISYTTGYINNDSYPDAIIGRANFQDELLLYGGATGFQVSVLTGSAGSTWSFPRIDINQDGYEDIVFNNDPGPSKAMLGLATGGYSAVGAYGPLYNIYDRFIDLNADGTKDLIVYNGTLGIIYGNSGVSYTGISLSQLTGPGGSPIPSSYTSWVSADIDGDGFKDLLMAPGASNSNAQVIVIYGNSARSEYLPLSLNTWKMEEGDFNNDGMDDVIVNPAVGFSSPNGAIIYGSRGSTGMYTTILSSTGNISQRHSLLVGDETIPSQNRIEYTIYATTGANVCDMEMELVSTRESSNGEIDISAITGSYSSICVKAELSILTGTESPALRSIVGTWDNEDTQSFTFDVKVKSGNFSGNTVTNTAYITSASLESTTGNNVDTHIFAGLPDNVPVGGFGGGEGGGGNGAGGGGVRGDAVETSVDGKSNSTEHEKKTEKTEYNNLTPQEIGNIIKELDAAKPETPLVFAPPRQEISQTVEINTATPTSAIRDAITQTTSVGAGQTVEVKMITNPSLSTEKRCYTPKEVVDITLGQNTTNKDLLVYQALLKSYDLTIFTNTDSYMPDKGLKRYEAAKMFVNFAKHVLCREAKSVYIEGTYKDIKGIDATLLPYIKQAYEYGIMKGGNGAFRPIEKISRREFVAALMRMFMNQYLEETNKDRYQNYEDAFNAYGLDTIVGVDDEIDRYDMSKIMYKLYYNTSYQWTDKGYVLPYGRD